MARHKPNVNRLPVPEKNCKCASNILEVLTIAGGLVGETELSTVTDYCFPSEDMNDVRRFYT